MLSFHGSSELKALYVNRVRQAIEMGNLVAGTFGEQTNVGWRGCALGVITHKTGGFKKMEDEMGIPLEIISCIPDIFDTLSKIEREKFALDFIESIPVGVEISFQPFFEKTAVVRKEWEDILIRNDYQFPIYQEYSRNLAKIIIAHLSSLTPVVEEESTLPVLNETLLAAV